MERAVVNGVELEYEVRGSGEPVLLIGGSHVANAFVPLLAEPALASQYQLMVYQRRGLAGSTHTPPPVSIADQSTDACGLLDHLGVRHAHVAGQSYGGVIGLQLALDRPEIVQSLALLEPALLTVPSGEALMVELGPCFGAHDAGDKEGAVAGFMAVASGLDWTACQAVIEECAPGGVDQAVKDADTFFTIEIPALAEWAFGPEQAAAISQPVLSMLGSQTHAVFAEGRELLHSWFPRIQEFDVQGAGHLLQMQRPESVATGLAEFFAVHPITSE